MKKIYIAHPFQGKRSNLQAITHICQRLMKFGVMPISPVHSFGFLNENVSEEREKALTFCEELVSTADEVWFFGDWKHSVGCKREYDVAAQEFKQVRIVTGWKEDRPIFWAEPPKWLKFITEPSLRGGENI